MTRIFESVNDSKQIELKRYSDGSALLGAYSQWPTTYIGASFANGDEFLAAVAREFDVTITANPKPPKVGDVVDREAAFGLPRGSLVEVVQTGAPYYRAGKDTLVHRFGSKFTIDNFDTDEKFTIKYIGGNA